MGKRSQQAKLETMIRDALAYPHDTVRTLALEATRQCFPKLTDQQFQAEVERLLPDAPEVTNPPGVIHVELDEQGRATWIGIQQ